MIQQRNFATYLLLTLVTCGIYHYIFFYKWNEDVNLLCGGDGYSDMDYIIVILLSIVTCGIYYYIWMYRQQNRLYYMAQSRGVFRVESGSTVLLWTLLGAFIVVGPIIAMYQMIDGINTLARQDGNINDYYK